MSIQTRKRLLAYLAGATFAAAPGAGSVLTTDLSAVPESFIGGILDEVEGTGWRSDDRLALLRVLADDRRPKVRARVLKLMADARPSLSLEAIEPILLRMSEEAPNDMREAMAFLLGTALGEANGLTRTRVVSEWALSESPGVRNVIALALGNQPMCVGWISAAALLAEDSDPDVRAAISFTLESAAYG